MPPPNIPVLRTVIVVTMHDLETHIIDLATLTPIFLGPLTACTVSLAN